MKNAILILTICSFFYQDLVLAQPNGGVVFSIDVDNSEPPVSVVSVYAQYDGAGNGPNASGYTVALYYNAEEATSTSADVDYTPTADLGWDIPGNTTYSNLMNINPNVPIIHTHRIQVDVIDGVFNGTDFPQSPTLILRISFDKTVGDPETGGEVYVGATADTDPPIVYFNNSFEGWDVEIIGDRQVVLPLDLISFTARKYNDKNVMLQWATANEVGTSHFVIERSLDLHYWEALGKVKAAGYSVDIRKYSFEDKNVYDGRSNNARFYYRLLIVDIDGQTSLSNIEVVRFTKDGATPAVFVYPNPSTRGVYVELIEFESHKASEILFYNELGQIILVHKVPQHSSIEFIDFAKSNISTGLYMLQVLNDDAGVISTNKIVVHR